MKFAVLLLLAAQLLTSSAMAATTSCAGIADADLAHLTQNLGPVMIAGQSRYGSKSFVRVGDSCAGTDQLANEVAMYNFNSANQTVELFSCVGGQTAAIDGQLACEETTPVKLVTLTAATVQTAVKKPSKPVAKKPAPHRKHHGSYCQASGEECWGLYCDDCCHGGDNGGSFLLWGTCN